MLHDLRTALTPGVMGRLTLLLNHVLGREPAAMERLRPHAGAVLHVVPSGWPSLLPAPPDAVFRITPAGLLEWVGPDAPAAAELRVLIDASNPAALAVDVLSGIAPQVRIEGDSRLAGDVHWIFDNVRWDIADDLEGLLGPGPAAVLSRIGAGIRKGVDLAVKGAASVGGTFRPPSR